MKRLALLVSEDPGDLAAFSGEDHLLAEALKSRGWAARPIPWPRAGAVAADFDAALIRGTWDYHLRRAEFLDTLSELRCPVWNPSPLARWNSDKRYLESLAAAGVPVVPTLFETGLPDLETARRHFGVSALVCKPAVGASAYLTFLVGPHQDAGPARAALAGKACLVQPYLEEIAREGEASLIYFGERFSHAVRKRPAAGDFRVQEELGGRSAPMQPSTAELDLGAQALAALPTPPLYARVDMVKLRGRPVVMEIELIEPVLYLAKAPGSADRFARAIASVLE